MAKKSTSNPTSSLSPPVEVFTLGQSLIKVDGQPLRFGQKAQRKPLELLKLLIALGSVSIPAQKLMDSLWPDSDGDQAQSAFYTTLHRLRRLIGHGTLIFSDSRLSLDPREIWVDFTVFQELLNQASQAFEDKGAECAWPYLAQTLALYKGPFLDGDFDTPVILLARKNLQRTFLRHIERFGEDYMRAGQHAEAILLFQKGLEVDELNEGLYRKLMRSYLSQERFAEGISVYRALRLILQVEAGVEPSSETEAVHEALVSEGGNQKVTDSGLAANPSAAAFGIDISFPEKPSIAVLAFQNIGGDPEQEYFSFGLAEDIITDLSQFSKLFVIARTSSFVYKDKPVDVRQVGKELGVHYLLEGSIRIANDHLRATMQLVETSNGGHVWARRYDHKLTDFFALQDEITRDIATEMEVKLLEGEHARASRRTTNNQEAYELFMRGRVLIRNFTKADNARARQLGEKAFKIDPNFALALCLQGTAYASDGFNVFSEDQDACFNRAIIFCHKALALDHSLGEAHTLLCRSLLYQGENDLSIQHGEQAVHIAPADSSANAMLGASLSRSNRGEEALPRIKTAMRLNPFPPIWFFGVLALTYRCLGEFDNAITVYRKCVERVPSYINPHIGLILALMETGEQKEAQAHVTQLLTISPGYNCASSPYLASIRDLEQRDRFYNYLRKAGLPT